MTGRFELQGHRGARGLYPENTLAGFAAALAHGIDSIELDVAVTADDVAVVSHDPVLNPDIARGADGAWLAKPGPAIRTLTLAELQRYDVGRLTPGSPYAALYPAQQPQDGARIPTLAEVFRAIPIPIDAEIKTLPDQPRLTVPPDVMAEAIIAVAGAETALGRLTVRSFDWRGLRHMKRRHPDIPLVWLTSADTVEHAALWWDGPVPSDFGGSVPAAIAAEGGKTWAPHHATLTPALIEEAHGLGLRVLAWTVNEPADMQLLVAWAVDGICTDRPDLFQRAWRANPPPQPSPSGGEGEKSVRP